MADALLPGLLLAGPDVGEDIADSIDIGGCMCVCMCVRVCMWVHVCMYVCAPGS